MERKMLEGLIFQYLLNDYEWYRLFNGEKEKWVDFLGWFYPRLSRAIDYYKDRHTSFDTYINTIVQWSSKEYKIREAEHRATEYVFWKARAEEMQACSHEPEYPERIPLEAPTEYTGLAYSTEPCSGVASTMRASTMRDSPLELLYNDEAVGRNPMPETSAKSCIANAKITPKQILLLVLKSYYFMTDDFLNRITDTVGIGKNELQILIDRLHDMRSKREAHLRDMQDKVHSQYYRCLSFEKRLSSTYEGTAKHAKLTRYLDNARKRFLTMRKRLGGIRMDATNQQIATLLNVPKGTVDSALHTIREKWRVANVAYS
jgi:hypothetical protein